MSTDAQCDGPLTFMSSGELLEELAKRYDAMVFIARADRRAERAHVVQFVRGDTHLVLGLGVHFLVDGMLSQLTLDAAHEEGNAESDDDE